MDLHVVALARVEVDVERAVLGEQAPGVAQARCEEADVVLEGVGIGQRPHLLRAVAPPREAGAIARLVGHRAQRPAALIVPGVERRVDVDDVEGAVGQAREDVEVVAVDEQVVVQRHARRKFGGSDELHAHDVMDTPGCGRVGPVGARRCMRVAGLRRWRSSPCSGRRSSSPSTARRRPRAARRARWARASSAAWPRRKPFNYVPAQRAAYEQRRRARPQPRALRQEPGRRRGLGPSARRTGGRSSTASPRPTSSTPSMLEAIVMLESAGRPDARALQRPALGRGPDPDPRRDRPEPARPAHRRQGLRAPHARHPARAARAPARGAAPSASTSASTRPRRSRRRRATWTSPRASSAATTSPSSPTTWAWATCSRR